MTDVSRFTGWFHRSDDPDTTVPGILTWSDTDGATLELIGSLGPPPIFEEIAPNSRRRTDPVSDSSPVTIYGTVESHHLLTLWAPELGNHRSHNGQVFEEFWHSSWLCRGAHIPSTEHPVFHRVVIGLDDLIHMTSDQRLLPPKWAEIEGVEHPGERQEDGTLLMPYLLPVIGGNKASIDQGSLRETRFSVETLATRPWISPATESDPSLKLSFMTKTRRRGTTLELAVTARALLARADGSPLSAEDVLEAAQPLIGLMALARFGKPGLEYITAKTEERDGVSLHCQIGTPASPDEVSRSSELVFTLAQVPLQQFLDAWSKLTISAQATYAWNVVIGLIGHTSRVVEEEVSQVLAAAESLERWCLGGVEAAHLSERLANLHDRLPDEVKAQLGLDVTQWTSWAVWLRNHVDHGGAAKMRALGDAYQVKVVADSVRLVSYLAALHAIGAPPKSMTDALLQHPRLSVLRDRCAKLAKLPRFDETPANHLDQP